MRWNPRTLLRLALLLPLGACSAHGFVYISATGTWSGFQHKASKVESLPIDLGQGETLALDLGYGPIAVRVSETERPHVEADISVRGRTQAEAEKHLAKVKLTQQRTGRGLKVWIEGDPIRIVQERTKSRVREINLRATVRLTAVVRPRTPLHARSTSGDISAKGGLGACDLHTRYGSVELSGARGDVKLGSNNGKLTLNEVDGGRVDLETSYGAIELGDIKGSRVNVKTNSGTIRADGIAADSITLYSRYGKLYLEGIGGRLEAKTNSGQIELRGASGPELALESGYGSILVENARGDLTAKSSSGTVRIVGLRGGVRAESRYGSVKVNGIVGPVFAKSNSGAVEVAALSGSSNDDDWELTSGNGKIVLAVPAGFRADISAHTRYGYVETELPIEMQGKIEKGYLKGTLRGGGPSVKLETSSGNIYLKKVRAKKPSRRKPSDK